MGNLIKPEGFDFFIQLTGEAITQINLPIRGQSQKERTTAEGHRRGLQAGVCMALSVYGNSVRAEKYSKFEWIAALGGYDFEKFLREMADEYSILEDKSTDMFWVAWHNKFMDIVLSPELEDNERNRHRAAVLKGDEAPTEADKQWLEDQIKENRRVLSDLEKLIKK
jgi:hypothetical protein